MPRRPGRVYKQAAMDGDFEPELFTVLREGYSRAQLLRDALAGRVGMIPFIAS